MTQSLIEKLEANIMPHLNNYWNAAFRQAIAIVREYEAAKFRAVERMLLGGDPPMKLVTQEYADSCGLAPEETTDPDQAGFPRPGHSADHAIYQCGKKYDYTKYGVYRHDVVRDQPLTDADKQEAVNLLITGYRLGSRYDSMAPGMQSALRDLLEVFELRRK